MEAAEGDAKSGLTLEDLMQYMERRFGDMEQRFGEQQEFNQQVQQSLAEQRGVIEDQINRTIRLGQLNVANHSVDDVICSEMANLSLDPSSLYRALIVGKVEDGYIRWPSELPIFGVTSIMIRECYVSIYNSILQSCGRKKRNLVTGVPGIGKSLFALYFAWRYCVEHPGKGFIFEKIVDEIWLFHPQHLFKQLTRAEARRINDVPYLVDLIEKKLPGELIGCFGVVFSSPCPDRFKEWIKNPGISERYVMPTWSVSELESVLVKDASSELDSDEMLQRYEKVGGVPRLVLYGSDEFFNGKLTNALSIKGQAISEKFFVGGFGIADDDMSYLLVHIHPLNHGTDEVVYKTWVENYSFASPYIWKKLYMLNCTQIINKARNYFNTGVGSGGGTLAGFQFENICLRGVPISGKQLEMQSLSTASAPSVWINVPEMSTLGRNWKSNALQVDVLYVPIIGNLESGDAFFLQSSTNTLYVLQITVGETHPVKANGLNAIFERFSNVCVRDCCLVFVTPKNGQLRTHQNIVTKKGERSTALSEAARKFGNNQWLLEYEIPLPANTI